VRIEGTYTPDPWVDTSRWGIPERVPLFDSSVNRIGMATLKRGQDGSISYSADVDGSYALAKFNLSVGRQCFNRNRPMFSVRSAHVVKEEE
jgi:hypothetical protein